MMVVDSQTPEWQVAAGPAAAARGRLGATAWDQPLTGAKVRAVQSRSKETLKPPTAHCLT
jgi:hypothetical protein